MTRVAEIVLTYAAAAAWQAGDCQRARRRSSLDLISGLKGTVAGLGLPSGTANSLLSKLDDAIKLANAGKVKAACNSLQDFISAVTAQTGKKISPSDASTLIAAADSIRSVLGC